MTRSDLLTKLGNIRTQAADNKRVVGLCDTLIALVTDEPVIDQQAGQGNENRQGRSASAP